MNYIRNPKTYPSIKEPPYQRNMLVRGDLILLK